MSRYLLTALAIALVSLATGCCGGYGSCGACRPSPCASYAPAYNPVASAGCSTCNGGF